MSSSRISRALAPALLLVLAGARGSQAQDSAPMPYEGTWTVTGTIPRVDITCILRTWRIKGVLVCTHGFDVDVCLWVENAWPCGIFEVLRQPYRTHYAEMKGAVQAMSPVAMGKTSASQSPVAGDGTANQYAETRVYTFVPDLGLSNSDIPLAIPGGSLFQPNYVSELDSLGWRSPLVDELTTPEFQLARIRSCGMIPDPMNCIGTWGSYFPRIGSVNHPSQTLAAAIQALRAGRAASRPIGRVVMSAYSYEPRTGHFIQMLEPLWKPAISIGTPFPELLDIGAGSKYGNYLFLHFGIFEGCSGCLPVILTGPRPPI